MGRAIKKLGVEVQVPKEEWRPREKVPISVSVKDSTGQPRRDFLQKPTVAIRVAESGERAVTGVIGFRPTEPVTCSIGNNLLDSPDKFGYY